MRQIIGIFGFLGFMAALWYAGGVEENLKQTDNKTDDRYISIATGGLTGIYYPVGGAMCRLINRETDKHAYQCSVESTGGTVYNLNALAGGEFDFAVAQSDLIHHAYHGGKDSAKSVTHNPDLRTVLTLYTEPLNLLARDPKVKKFEDLKERRINIGAPGSGQRATMKALFKAAGLTRESFSQLSGLNPVEQTLALCDTKVDAIAYVVGNPNGSIQEAASTCEAHLLNIDEALIDRLVADKPYYFKSVVPQEMYKGSEGDVHTFGVKVVLTALDSLDKKQVKTLVKAVVENFEMFKRLHPVLTSLTVDDLLSTKGLVAPQHEGVKEYIRERNKAKKRHRSSKERKS